MLKMPDINYIRDLSSMGYKIAEIAKKTCNDPKTIRKYLNEEDFSPAPPVSEPKPSILDSYKPKIDKILEEDKHVWFKQKHTAQRIYERLVEEDGFTGSYNTVQRYVKLVRGTVNAAGKNELIWDAGTAQVDFGEADFNIKGKLYRLKYLVVSFPYSNDAFSQIFGGETSECVCQGLKNIFEYIGKVPHTLIFDNATGVGRRVGDTIHETELFQRFRAHYKTVVKFCNPYAGYEKGNVENKVGYIRANTFVPIPMINNLNDYNKSLLDEHIKKAGEIHYKKGILISKLFKDDLAAMIELPTKSFEVCTYKWVNADGYGKICLDGKHYYSTKPENARRKVLVGIYANVIRVLKENGNILVEHERQYGDTRTDLCDYSTSVNQLLSTPGSWHNSGIRKEAPEMLRKYMDSLSRKELKATIKILFDLTQTHDMHTAFKAMEMSLAQGSINICDAAVLADRIEGYGIDTPPESGPSLEVYDNAFLGGTNNAQCIS